MDAILKTKIAKCPKGTRKNKKTNICEPVATKLVVFKNIKLNDTNTEKFNEYRQRYMEQLSDNKLTYLPREILKQDEDKQIEWIIKHGENTTLKLLQSAFDRFYKMNEVNLSMLNVDEINKKWNEYFDKYDEDDILNATTIKSDTILKKQKDTPVLVKTTVCPPGKEINPKTGRCVNIKKPKTTRKMTTTTVTLPSLSSEYSNVKDCPPGKEINPKTGRCINIKKPKTTRKIRVKNIVPEPIQPVKLNEDIRSLMRQFEDMMIEKNDIEDIPPYQGPMSNIEDFKQLLYYTLNNNKVFKLYKLDELTEKRSESFINVNNSINLISLDNFKNIAKELLFDNQISKSWIRRQQKMFDTTDFDEKIYYFDHLMQIISWNDLVRQYGKKRIDSKDVSVMKLTIENIKNEYKYSQTFTNYSIHMLVQYKYILDKTKLSDNNKENIIFDLITLSINTTLENGYKDDDVDEINILRVIFGTTTQYDPNLFL